MENGPGGTAASTVDRVDVADAAGAGPAPYVPPEVSMPELTVPAVLTGAILGIVFGASSMYLVLKIGMTVSASIPVAVLSITLFRAFSSAFGMRPATILENNIVQTTGSAGESIAFGAGVTMPALLILGFDMSIERIMLVAVLGGLLGILMMIPLRRAFIVEQHENLAYPEGTACAEVLKVGETGGTSAAMVFSGFFFAFIFRVLNRGMALFLEEVSAPVRGLKGAYAQMDVAPELLGVGYIIGPRIASTMVAGGVLAYLVLAPAIVMFGEGLAQPLVPETTKLIRDMSAGEIRNAYILYIGAGAVAAGGIISMFRVLPMIVRSARAGLRDISRKRAGEPLAVPRTERDLSLKFVIFGSLGLVAVIWFVPAFHMNALGALLIVLCGFLFVTVSSRLTGEVGSSSNPISGMTVATLLITCLVFLALGWTGIEDRVAALSIAGIVCIAASNGGTTSQDLKTGYLVGATPRAQQISILIGALSSALVIGFVLKGMNDSQTVYTKKDLPAITVPEDQLVPGAREAPGNRVADTTLYRTWFARPGNTLGAPEGKYLIDDAGKLAYFVDPAINGKAEQHDNGDARKPYEAPKTRLMAIIIDGILTQKLPWGLVILGVLIAVTLELAGVSSLPFAVGVYLPLGASTPIFLGGAVRYAVDRWRKMRTGQGESDSSPGVLMSSGYIAGGSIALVLIAFLNFKPDWVEALHTGGSESTILALMTMIVASVILFLAGTLWRAPVEPPSGPLARR